MLRAPSCEPRCLPLPRRLRPTKGLSSIDGIIPLAHTQDVGGPLARRVTDLAVALDATVGPDPADPATGALEGREVPRFVEALDPPALEAACLGVVEELFGDPPEDEEVDSILRADVGRMADLGADTVTGDVPQLDSLVWQSADAHLVAMAYAYEQGVHPRRFPPAAPPLVDGKAPEPVAFEVTASTGPGEGGALRGRFAFDPVSETLAFDLEVSGIAEEDVYAVALHRVGGESPGPLIHRLAGPGQSREVGVAPYGNPGAEELLAGRLSLVLFTAAHPRGLFREVLRLPAAEEPL